MKIVFLDAKTVGDVAGMKEFEAFGDFVRYETSAPEDVYERCTDADVIITNKVIVDGELMKHCKNLRLICVAATGTNNIDHTSAESLGIAVRNVKGYSTDSVAQHTFAMLFSLIHKISWYDNYVKSGQYSENDIFTCLREEYFELKGKTYGIIGLGEIGRRVADIARVFGAEVVYHSSSGNNTEQPYPHLSLIDLLNSSDVVSIHAALNEHTQNLLDYKELSEMKRTGILVNVGRGGIVNEEALALALDEGLLSGAALDVFKEEPIKAGSPLLNVKEKNKLILSPHIAWAGREARETLVQGVLSNIREFFRSEG